MDEFDGLPLYVQNILKRSGVTSLESARALGREAIAQMPGVGPLALSRLFPSGGGGEPSPRVANLSADDLKRARRWFEVLQEAAPLRVHDADRVLAEKLARLLD